MRIELWCKYRCSLIKHQIFCTKNLEKYHHLILKRFKYKNGRF